MEFEGYDHMKTCLKLFHHSMFDDGLSAPRKINVELTYVPHVPPLIAGIRTWTDKQTVGLAEVVILKTEKQRFKERMRS